MKNIVCIFTLWFCIGVRAATYYVSSSLGNSTNPGTSEAFPWLNISNVYYNTYGGRAYNPGDSILFKSGESFCGPLFLNQGGTEGSPITIGSYGDGPKPVIYGDFSNAVWSAVGGHSGVYSTYVGAQGPSGVNMVYDVNGALYTNTNQGTNTLDGWLNTFTNGNYGISALIVYVRTLDDNPPPRMYLLVSSILTLTGDYHTVTNLDICRGGHAVNLGGVGSIVTNNVMHDLTGSGVFLNNGSHSLISGNLVTNTSYTQIYIVNGGSNWVHHNELHKTSLTILSNVTLTGVSDRSNIGLLGGTNNLVEHNNLSHAYHAFFDYFYETASEVRFNYGFSANHAASPDGTGLRLHHNIFNLDGVGSGISGQHNYDTNYSTGPDIGTNYVYNNVVFNFTSYGIFSGTNDSARMSYLNNLLVTDSTSASMVQVHSGIEIDYNVFYYTSGSPVRWVWNGMAKTSFESYISDSGQDGNSIYADPQFISDDPMASGDFQIKSSSPAVNSGLDLRVFGIVPYGESYSDFLGTTIPKGGGADMGAFEYFNLSATANMATVGTIVVE